MRKFITTFTGLHRLKLSDLGFIDAKINEIVAALASTGGDGCILSGCELAQGATNWQVAAGYVLMFGEVYSLAAGDTGLAKASDPLTLLRFNVDQEIVTPLSPVSYHDGNSHNVHFTRVATLTTGSGINYGALLPYEQVLANKLSAATPWINVGDAGAPAYESHYTGDLRFKKDAFGWVHIEGTISADGSAGSTSMVFLPAGCRPDRQIIFMCMKNAGGTRTLEALKIEITGQLHVADLDTSVTYEIILPPFMGY